MYDGKTPSDLEKLRGLRKGTGLDHMGSTELAANWFRQTQTAELIKSEQPKDKKRSNEIHYNVGKKVRETMIEISGKAPEDLPVCENIKKIERNVKQLENAAKSIEKKNKDQ